MTTSPDTIIATYGTDAAALVTIDGYTKHHGITERTLRRWLAADELPGARLIDGAWAIPINATRTPAPKGTVVTLTPDRTRDTTPNRRDVVPAPPMDALPSFLTVAHAAHLLGISQHAIAKHREYFDVVPFGPNGSLVVPLATIKRIRG